VDPKVSVIVRTRDRFGLLGEALSALRSQRMQDFETLVVNDGGKEPPRELLDPPPGRGLTLLSSEPPHGRTRALNTGVAAARGRYLAFLDDDDLWQEDHLETLLRFLEGTDLYRGAYTDAMRVFERLGEDGRYTEVRREPAESRDFDPARLLYFNHVPLICVMLERSLAAEVGPFDESFDLYEDWEYLIRVSRVARVHHLRRETALYRVRDDGTNATTEAPWLGARAQEARGRVARKHWPLRTAEGEMALLDGLQHETREARRMLDEETRRAAEAERRLSEELAAKSQLAERLGSELKSVRADAARVVQAAGERETRLTRERNELGQRLDAVNRSFAWRLFTPWWKLKARLSR